MAQSFAVLFCLSVLLSGCGVGLNNKEDASTSSAQSHKKPQLTPVTPVKGDIDKVLCAFNEPVSERIEKVSASFMGKPSSGDGPLGEGQSGKYDRDPLFRSDTFDCTTFVETVIARAVSKTPEEFQLNINKIRYKNGEVSFVARNHFPSLDWIPNNIEAGFVRDITASVAGSDENLSEAVAEIDKSEWYWAMKPNRLQGFDDAPVVERMSLWADLRLEGRQFSPQIARLPYVPLTVLFPENEDPDQEAIDKLETLLEEKTKEHQDKLAEEGLGEDQIKGIKDAFSKFKASIEFQILAFQHKINYAIVARIPSGSVINIVRPNWDLKKWIGTNMNVSHQGFVIRKGDSILIRHASLGREKSVVEEELIPYLLKYINSSTLKGFNILEVMDGVPGMPTYSAGASGIGNSCPI